MSDFNPLADLPSNQQPATTGPKPFGTKERMITTLLFDTQPKRKKAFIEKLGYEVNPKDDNEIRPIGSDEHAYFPIDPGGIFNWNQYIKSNGVDGSEILKDVVEAIGDTIQGGMTESAGIGGGIIGAAAGPVGAVAGRSAGRVAMFRAIESMKDSMGNLFLDKDVPIDDALRATQTAVQAIAPEVLAAGGSALKAAAVKSAQGVSTGVRNLLSIGDGKIGKQAWDALRANPSALDNTKVLSQASESIDSTVEHMLGKTSDGYSINNSAFAPKLNAMETERKVQSDILSQDPNNGAPLDKMIKFFEQKKMDLSDPAKFPIQSQQRKDGISYIDEKIGDLKSLIKPSSPGSVSSESENRLSFGQIDSIVKEMQGDLYSSNKVGKDWRSAVKSLVDGTPDAPGINNLLKEKATAAGSPYAQLKQKQSEIFNAYEGIRDNVDTKKARRFILGDEIKDPTGTSTDTIARDFGNAVQKADKVLGTKMYEGLQTGQIQNQFYKAVAEKGATGSGGTNKVMLGTGAATYGALKMAHVPSEVAVPMAGIVAAGAGALAQPRVGVKAAIGAENLANKLSGMGPSDAVSGLVGQTASQEAIQNIPSQQQDAPQEFDPLSDFDPLKDMEK